MSTTALAMAVATLLAIPWIFRAILEVVRDRAWDLTATLVFVAGLEGGLPTALTNLLDPHAEVFDASGEVEVGLSGWAAGLETALSGLALVVAVVSLVIGGPRRILSPTPLIALTIVVVGVVSSVGHSGAVALRTVALIVLLLAAATARPGRSAALGASAVGVLYAVLGGVQTVLNPAFAVRACRSDKCGLTGDLYIGALTNENVLGLVLALTVVSAALAYRGRVGVVLAGYLAVTAVATGSRTTIAAAVGAVVLLLLLRPRLATLGDADSADPRARGTLPAWLAGAVVIVPAAIGMIMPFLPGLPALVEDRADFWSLALDGIARFPVLGQGATAWSDLYDSGYLPIAAAYAPHNQWLDIAYASGLLGICLFAVLIGAMLVRAGDQRAAIVCVLVPVLVVGVLERPWSFGLQDGLTFTLLAALLTAAPENQGAKSGQGSALRSARELTSTNKEAVP